MKKLMLYLAILLIFSSCNTQKSSKKINNNNIDSIKENKSSKKKHNSSLFEFEAIQEARDDQEKRTIISSKKINFKEKSESIAFHTILRSSDELSGVVYGALHNKENQTLINKDGSLRVSDRIDFTSLLEYKDELFMISHFETTPAALYMTKVKQDRDGNLQAQWIKNIDLSSIHGLWRPCAGSVTPWNTHLGSEEYPPDAKKIFIKSPVDPTFKLMALYVDNDIYDLNPYHYGWIPEIKIIDSDGDVKIKKHYAMGRFSHEVAYVMPDKKTLYLSDDIQNGVLFKFVADKKEDLSSGTLYAAKWIQTSSKPLQAEIKWISLGHSDNESIKEAIESGIEFGDLFVEAKRDSKNRCPKGFLPTNYNNQNECLQFKDGMKEIASRLESGRVAGMLQATTEFTKMEGITYNQNKNRLYIAISRVETSMRDNDPSDKGGSNDIRVPQNHCGMILSFKLNNFDITSATSLIAGIPNKNDNSCSLDAIAMPDNITFIPKADTLIIDEDSFAHQNNFIWAYNIKSKKLTKILSSPYGSETTSIYYYPNIKGFSYLMSVIQHPFGERDMEKIKFAGEKRAYLGYIGPFSIIE